MQKNELQLLAVTVCLQNTALNSFDITTNGTRARQGDRKFLIADHMQDLLAQFGACDMS